MARQAGWLARLIFGSKNARYRAELYTQIDDGVARSPDGFTVVVRELDAIRGVRGSYEAVLQSVLEELKVHGCIVVSCQEIGSARGNLIGRVATITARLVQRQLRQGAASPSLPDTIEKADAALSAAIEMEGLGLTYAGICEHCADAGIPACDKSPSALRAGACQAYAVAGDSDSILRVVRRAIAEGTSDGDHEDRVWLGIHASRQAIRVRDVSFAHEAEMALDTEVDWVQRQLSQGTAPNCCDHFWEARTKLDSFLRSAQ
jgi:hypothetical protein